MDSLTGEVSFITAPDFENPTDAGSNNVYDITVTASDGSLTASQAVALTIVDDQPNITLDVLPNTVNEDGSTNLVYTFTRDSDLGNSLTVNYTIDGTATNGTDCGNIGTSIVFAANSATATLTIDPTADTTIENDETVALTLASGTGYAIGTTTAVTGTITNDDIPSIAINDITFVEGQSPNALLTLSIDRLINQTVSVGYTTTPVNATANLDYTSQTGTITIAPNSSFATLSIPILNDNTNEGDEGFIVTLSNPVNAILDPDFNIGQVTITDILRTA